MQRYFIELAYLGEPYHGWQIQPNAISVQQRIEEALSTLLRQPVPIVGAGRTDAGVNASRMIAHADFPALVADPERFVRSLNSILGPTIAIRRIAPVHPEAHARFDAIERTYHYYAHTGRSPFAGSLSWQAPPALDFEAMNRAAALLLDTSDFTSFSKLHTDVKTNICSVTRARWERMPDPYGETGVERWCFEISADRFLRNMVRAVVGTLVDVGRGKIGLPEFRAIIDRRDRCAAGTSMPPGPLFLHDIKYPYPF